MKQILISLCVVLCMSGYSGGMVYGQEKTADIIVAVDTSGSMDDEAGFVQNNMNAFASNLSQNGIDYHLVLISTEICLPAPVGSGSCPDDANLPSYLHIFEGVGSNNALDKIIANYNTWAPQMRPEAPKHIIVVTDDDSALAASDFNAAFLALDPSHEGYSFHAIASPEDPLLACVAQTVCCPDLVPLSAALGQQYIDLTGITGGLFNNLCLQDFTPFFQEMAMAVVQSLPLVFHDGFEASSGDSCDDGILNQDETDLDCGGEICDGCELGNACLVASDCLSNNCSIEGFCQF